MTQEEVNAGLGVAPETHHQNPNCDVILLRVYATAIPIVGIAADQASR